MGVGREDWPALIRPLFSLRNIAGALVTMPLKVGTAELVDELSIAASLAGAGAAGIVLFDTRPAMAETLAGRLRRHYPALAATTGTPDPAGCDTVVNATPLGMDDDDPLPLDPDRLAAGCMVGEVVLRAQHTPLLRAALARGCAVQVGTDMLFEQIPAYLGLFGLEVATVDALRAAAVASHSPAS